MSLSEYTRKRRFDSTPEPAGTAKKVKHRRLEFVVQKHDASRLHYDFRLEMGGSLKSWAVPKGPSLRSEDKRLAMMVEDHPFEYRKFEGVIPKGNYGAGSVIIWDRGTYRPRKASDEPEKELLKELAKGHITFVLKGEKLKGEFALIKNERAGDDAWLLIKKGDEQASKIDITRKDKSVVSGKAVDEVGGRVHLKLDDLPTSDIPRKVKPMLATLTKEAFDDPDWLFEIKWDGYRAIASWDGQRAELYSRNGNDYSSKYPEVYEAVRQLSNHVVLDGEIIAADKDGKAHFEWLQNWGRRARGQLIYYVFDILWCDGHDLSKQPLSERKKILQTILADSPTVRYSDHILAKGVGFFRSAIDQKLEGIMAKSADSTYQTDYRSKQWLKIKTHQRQEAVIGGFTEPRGGRKYIGALVLGVYDGDDLIYVGHTGGGIPTELMPGLHKQLLQLERKTSPFANKFKPNAPVHWVKPQMICEVSFAEWTADGHMRQPIFVGLRQDKQPKDIVKEVMLTNRKVKNKTVPKSSTKVNFTHPEKIFFPKSGYTKGDLIDYYQSVAEIMLPYLDDRPCNLLRQPNGLTGQSFFQKDMASHPGWIKTATIYSESNQKNIHYLVCDSVDALLYMVQLGSIEINPWNSRASNLDYPDWIVMDLDPENIGFDEVVEVALAARAVLDDLGIESYPKTSGKTGLHIYIPLAARYHYDQARQFGEILANLIHQKIPNITSLERNPKKRQKKIYIDFLQNREGQTLAAPYSVRPTEQATVSTPLKWSEINQKLSPDNFTFKSIQRRLNKVGDLWKPVIGRGVDIASILDRL